MLQDSRWWMRCLRFLPPPGLTSRPPSRTLQLRRRSPTTLRPTVPPQRQLQLRDAPRHVYTPFPTKPFPAHPGESASAPGRLGPEKRPFVHHGADARSESGDEHIGRLFLPGHTGAVHQVAAGGLQHKSTRANNSIRFRPPSQRSPPLEKRPPRHNPHHSPRRGGNSYVAG